MTTSPSGFDPRGLPNTSSLRMVAFADWHEIAADVYVRTYDHLEINISVVRGGDELVGGGQPFVTHRGGVGADP